MHQIKKFEGSARECTYISCYNKIVKVKGAKEARAKTRRVVTYCDSCENKPPMCLDCYNKIHIV